MTRVPDKDEETMYECNIVDRIPSMAQATVIIS